MSHKGHPDCPYSTKKACDQARREAMGPCVADVGDDEPRPCRNWAVTDIGGRKLCGQHANSYAIQFDAEQRRQLRRAEISDRIEAYLAWTAEHPSIHDFMPPR